MRPTRVAALLVLAILLPILALYGCGTKKVAPLSPIITQTSDGLVAPQVPAEVLDQLARLQRNAGEGDRGLASMIRDPADPMAPTLPVVVPAGSVDALAAAIAAAGPNGIVVLKRGLHTENSTVTITQRVAIIGESGAVLQSAVTPSNELPTVVRPALYVHGAPGVKIWDVAMAPTGAVGGNGILLEDSPRSIIGLCSLQNFQYSILLQHSDASIVIGNHVVANTGWQTGDPIECDGIININGSGVIISGNDVSGGLLNVFCSGSSGFYLSNTAHDGFVGMILCDVPESSFLLPSGASVGSEISGTRWTVLGNTGSRNIYAGQLVIDGANYNTIAGMTGGGNGAYDIELLGVSCLFGFETPTSFNNTVFVGTHHDLTINDFGRDNKIIGQATVTHNVSVPCAAATMVSGRINR